MKLFVPACGDRLTLIEPWEFSLFLEHRNMKFAKERKIYSPIINEWEAWEGKAYQSAYKKVPVLLEKGTVLECDRVYVRLFNKSNVKTDDDFDSITWKVMKGDKPAKNQRFWAKLVDCNRIEFELDTNAVYRDRVKAVRQVFEE